MNIYFLVAAIFAGLVGLIHSALGEFLIFKKLRTTGVIPKVAAPPLQARNIRILWATWHLASVFGFAFAGILFSLATNNHVPDATIINALIFAFVGGSALVLVATSAKHPGWVGLLAVAILTYLGSVA